VDVSLDAGSSAGSRPSVTSLIRRAVHRIKRPSGESNTGFNKTKNGGQEGDNVHVRRNGTQLARPVVLNLKQADLGIMDNLEERLEAAKKLHGEAVDLQTFYESGTVATMQDLRATGKAVTCYLQIQYTETFDF
jgi:hypothetical protein